MKIKKQMKVPWGTARAKRRSGISEKGSDARKLWDEAQKSRAAKDQEQ